MRTSRYTVSTVSAGILWGIIGIFIKNLNANSLNPLQILLLRGVISCGMLFFFLFFSNKKLLKVQLKDIWMFFGTGVVSLTFFSLCYFKTILEAGASVAVILLYTSPVFVILISRFVFKEKITIIKTIALIMTFTGCFLVSGFFSGTNSVTPKSFIVGLGAGFGYALYSIFSRFALKKYTPLTVTFYTFLFSVLSIIPFCPIRELCFAFRGELIFWSLGIGLFCSILPYILYTFGLTGLETGKAAIFVTIEPLVGTLTGVCLYGEPIPPTKIIGIALIFAVIILLGTSRKKSSSDF